MTEPVIIAVVGGISTVLAAAVALLKREKTSESKLPTRPKEDSPMISVEVHPAKDSEPPKVEPSKVQKINSTHKEIADAIEGAPPFHRDKIKDSYDGLSVEWQLRLSSVSHLRDDVWIWGNIFDKNDENCSVCCESTPEDTKVFISAQEGWTFTVIGRIERISRYEVKLIECKFFDLCAVDPASGPGGKSSAN
jgi:hypothetical protein